MNDRSEKLPNELIGYNQASCSDTSCCPSKTPNTRDTPKIGRNDPCICGTKRKFKKCCGKNA